LLNVGSIEIDEFKIITIIHFTKMHIILEIFSVLTSSNF
jgi:hypothetical protein